MAVGDAHVSWLSHTSTNTNFLPTTFLTYFSRGERRKYAGKEFRLNRVSNSQPPGHESEKLTSEPPGRGVVRLTLKTGLKLPYNFLYDDNSDERITKRHKEEEELSQSLEKGKYLDNFAHTQKTHEALFGKRGLDTSPGCINPFPNKPLFLRV